MSEAKIGGAAKNRRPLSPHLQVYTPLVNMVMSIIHRLTGVALYAGTILLAWWLTAVAVGQDYFDFVSGIFASWPGKIVLLGYTWALIHHGLGGIRHFIWDTGRGYDLDTVDKLSWGTLIGSLLLTGLVWMAALNPGVGG